MKNSPLIVGAILGVAGCTPLPPPPLVAYPTPGKPPAAFAQDDAGCRAAAQSVPASIPASVPDGVPAGAAAQQQVQQQPLQPPPAIYLQCMAAHGNIIQPLAPPPYPAYAYAVPDPLYPGGDYAPFYTGGFVGFYGGCCVGRGFYDGGFRGGGFRGYR